jgi:ubiquinone/menaquinone biosynthesis C-methylase UbiE
MSSPYDTYDYPNYWEGREYEHASEIISLKYFLDKIKEINNIVEVGAGFARLTSSYIYRAKKIILTDPSSKLLSLAKKRFPERKVNIIHSTLDNLPNKLRRNSADLVILIRVLHHIRNLDKSFNSIGKILKKNGYFILEFANKCHGKATASEFVKGNFTFLHDIFPKDVKTHKSKKSNLPFLNYHPEVIKEKLKTHGFEVIDIRSVSNIRSAFIKRIIPTEIILPIEKLLQKPLAKIYFGPSIFILAQKRG